MIKLVVSTTWKDCHELMISNEMDNLQSSGYSVTDVTTKTTGFIFTTHRTKIYYEKLEKS